MSAAAAGLLANNAGVLAAGWPERRVRIIVPYAAGSVTDLIARVVAQALSEKLRQSFVVENKTGASGIIATDLVAHADGDGYTFLLTAPGPLVVIPQFQHVPYDPDQLVPVAVVGSFPLLLAVKPSLPVKNLPELIAYAKENPDKLNYSSGGVGQISHLAVARLASRAGIKLTHIPYNRGTALAVAALVSGEVDINLSSQSDLAAHIASNKIRVLATTAATRISSLPDVPTIGETYPDFVLNAWNGIVAPQGTPKLIADQFASILVNLSSSPEVSDRLKKVGITPGGPARAEFAKVIVKDKAFFSNAIQAAGLTHQP
jgi:tripartite-type tricarboxylate transporter receptor subunit TctC